MFFLVGTQGLDLPVGTQGLGLHVVQLPNAFVMQGLDLLGGLPRLASQELET